MAVCKSLRNKELQNRFFVFLGLTKGNELAVDYGCQSRLLAGAAAFQAKGIVRGPVSSIKGPDLFSIRTTENFIVWD
jgi:hypothetical protein